ncbi:META domain-containing protein [Methanospirillum stamsii]|uniref:DUF306 domain-containing protein n=1 Tax=Methanospirillum stamsii TaxID=1277351 RepID=A0A2V2N3Z1_9EURY|nr:META domain-containing protein [Methanospirillum stamsii]PWR73290.1 hypothetical protein DLD82_11060 [Methanospirillum stamsii]
MKRYSVALIVLLIALSLMAGCTSQPEERIPVVEQTETIATTEPVPEITEEKVAEKTLPKAPAFDPSLSGTWYLKLMSEQNGTAQVQTISPDITVVFEESGNISGNSGCNSYSGMFTLTGAELPEGKGITISPLISTRMYCEDKNETEKTYIQILQMATSYLVNVNEELSIMDDAGNTLVYQKVPYSETAVPQGS